MKNTYGKRAGTMTALAMLLVAASGRAQYIQDFESAEYIAAVGNALHGVTDAKANASWVVEHTTTPAGTALVEDANPSSGTQHVRIADTGAGNISARLNLANALPDITNGTIFVSLDMAVLEYDRQGPAYISLGSDTAFTDERNWVRVGMADDLAGTLFFVYRTNATEGVRHTLRVRSDTVGTAFTYTDGVYFNVSVEIDGPSGKFNSVTFNGVEQIGILNGIPEDAWIPNELVGTNPDFAFRMISGSATTMAALDIDNLSVIPEPAAAGLLLIAGAVWIVRRRLHSRAT